MLYAVIVGHAPGPPEAAERRAEERRHFLAALKRSGRLALEGTYGESGSLMFLEVDSTNDALALLQNDPYVLASRRVQIRPLVLNSVGDLRAPAERTQRRRASVPEIRAHRHEDRG